MPLQESKAVVWTGRVLSTLPVLVLLLSAAMKFAKPEGMEGLGYTNSHAIPIGLTELICTVLYIIPRTSVLGAILLTGYLGGATASHARLGQPVFVAPVLFGVIIWLGLFLRDRRLRDLIPLRKNQRRIDGQPGVDVGLGG